MGLIRSGNTTLTALSDTRAHFADIKGYANTIEQQGNDTDCTPERLPAENAQNLALAKKHRVEYILIDDQYQIPATPFALATPPYSFFSAHVHTL